MSNGIANFGTLQINSSGSDPTLAINGTVYLLNSGTIALIGPTDENRIVGVGGTGATLVNVNNTIIGSGTIGQGDGALTLVNGSERHDRGNAACCRQIQGFSSSIPEIPSAIPA